MSLSLPGTFGSYLLLDRIGSGAMGDVFLARRADGERSKPVVVKRLHFDLTANPTIVKRFRHEAEIAMTVDSLHVAKLTDCGIVDDVHFLVFEYIEGWPLSHVLQHLDARGAETSVASAVDITDGILNGLIALHGATDPTGQSLEIVHRDIAPKNIMVGADATTRLIDLGIGRSRMQDWQTATGVLLGSPGYMAPEQITGDAVDRRADIYATGVVLWEMLTMKHYIASGPLPQMLARGARPNFTAPSALRPSAKDLDEIVACALAVDPKDRYPDAGAMLRDLRAVVAPRASHEQCATLIDRMLWDELSEARTKVVDLMDLGSTTLASGAIHAVPPPVSTPPGAEPLIEPISSLGAPQSAVIAPAPVPVQLPAPAPPKSSADRWASRALLLALLAAIPAAFVAGGYNKQRQLERPPLAVPLEEAAVVPGARGDERPPDGAPAEGQVAQRDRNTAAERKADEPAHSDANTTAKRPKRKRTTKPRGSAEPAKDEPAPKQEPAAAPTRAELRARVDSLIERADALGRDGTGPLIAELLRLRTSSKLEDEVPRLDALAAKVRALESAPN